ncbi:hypothetical protein L204_103880 [Cryptococcus depauperatus]|nr:hypothetical protein L204_03037 [Cryptococcus depauperatus CBS 7855]
MQNPHVQVVLVEQLENELSNLNVDIANLNQTLLFPSSPVSPLLSPTKPPTKISRLVSVLNFPRPTPFKKQSKAAGRWTRGKYDKLEEPLLSRRGSVESTCSEDSDTTLVGSGNVHTITGESQTSRNEDQAGKLLALLAPVISTLQRLGMKLVAQGPNLSVKDYLELKKSYHSSCTTILELLTQLQTLKADDKEGNDGLDSHNMEMSHLMLEALIKKVKIEQDRFSASSPTTSSTKNPFVFQAITSSTRNRISKTKSIPISAASSGGREVSYRSFIANSTQSSWAMNVVRLGSFQASALFTPSPIAVRRIGDVGKA